MTENANVKLNINANTNGTAWNYALGSDGKEYGYKWLGGNGGGNNGNVEYNADGDSRTVTVTFNGSDGDDYTFDAFINLSGSPDLSGSVDAANNSIVITDKCMTVGTLKWGAVVSVNNTDPKVTFFCDPYIRNRS